MLAKLIGQATKTDGGEEVDGKPGILRRVSRHNTLEVLRHPRILQPLIQLPQTERLRELLEEDFDEDARRRCGRLLRELEIRQASPRDGVGGEEMSKKLCDVPEFVRLQAVDGGVLLQEHLVK